MYKTIQIKTNKKEELLNITNFVQKAISEENIRDGICLVYSPHTTAGITINEGADPDVRTDIIMALKSFKFESLPFNHTEGNSDAHTKATLTGSSAMLIIDDGSLVLGTWQAIYFCEYDGPRNRQIFVKAIGQ